MTGIRTTLPQERSAGAASSAAGDALPDPAVLDDALSLLAGLCGGRPPAVTGAELLGRRLSPVWRLRLSGGPASVVVKHLAPAWYGDPEHPGAPPEFREEAAVYDFFAALGPAGGDDWPHRLGWHRNGLLLLEDVGPADAERMPLPAVEPRVAAVLARLHAATAGRLGLLAACRARRGLPVADERTQGACAATADFAHGALLLDHWCALTGLAPAGAVAGWLAPVGTAMAAPGRFEALLHDDLVNGRQCVVRDGRLRLVDFEAARPGHMLGDIARVMIGKFERNLDSGAMVLMWPGFGPGLTRAYRAALAAAGGPQWREPDWAADFTTAALHAVVVQVGRLGALAQETTVAGGLTGNLAVLLERLDNVLNENTAGSVRVHETVRTLLRSLGGRIALF